MRKAGLPPEAIIEYVRLYREGRDLSGFCAAALLAAHGIDASCDVRTAAIENRQKTGPCPVESAVAGIEDIDAGIAAIRRRAEELRAGH